MSWITRILVAGMCVIILSTRSYGANYYVNTLNHDTELLITINGIPLNIDELASSNSDYIGQFLVDGDNKIGVTYIPTVKTNQMSYSKWSLVAVPDGKKMSSPDTKTLAKGEFRSRETDVAMLPNDAFTPVLGSKDTIGKIHFERNGKTVRFCGRLSKGAAFVRLPSQLVVDGLSAEITNVRIHIMKRDTPIKVTYSDLTLQEGTHDVSLTSAMLSDGRQWAEETGFDEVFIEGEIAGDTTAEPPVMYHLKFGEIQGIVHEDKELRISSADHWSWQDGDKYATLSDVERSQLRKEVQRMYDALGRKDFEQVRELLKLKTETLSRVMHEDVTILEAGQRQAFEHAVSKPGWKLAPLQSDNIEYELLNPQIVTLRTVDRKSVIRDVPATANDNGSGFELTLYYAHIGGQWMIIW